MEIFSHVQEDEGRFAARTLSDISIASNASGKAQNLSSLGAIRDTRVKFLCSHGGKILPRPSDKRLRYVGGDTRMITVPRLIQLTALKLKLAEVYGHDVTFKYQLPEEDLDALVSVSSDEDLENMMEECDRLDAMEGSSRLRVLVFSSLDQDANDFNDVVDPKVSEHRYVEAVNMVQADMPSRQIDNVNSYNNSVGLHTGFVWNTGVMDGKFPLSSGNLHSQVYPLEQFTPVGNYPFPMLPQKNNQLGHTGPPPHISITKKRNELASSLHANTISSHGPSLVTNDFVDLESEQTAYRIDEDQMLRAKPRDGGEALTNNKVHGAFTDPFLPTSEQIYALDTTTEDNNFVFEDRPLSPGALLQRQLLQADESHPEIDISRTFGKQDSQSSLDGNRQPAEACPLSHERQHIEQLPYHHPANDIIQEGLLAGGHFLYESLRVPFKVHPLPQGPCFAPFPASDTSTASSNLEVAEKPVVLLQQVKPQEAPLFTEVLPDVYYTKPPFDNNEGDLNVVLEIVREPFTESLSNSGLQTTTVGIDKMYELDGLRQYVLPSTNIHAGHILVSSLDCGIKSQALWQGPNLVSVSPTENIEIDQLDQRRHHSKVANALGVTADGLAGAGLSLLDELFNYNDKPSSAALSDAKVDLVSMAVRDCSMIDTVSDILPPSPVTNCCLSPWDALAATLHGPLAKIGNEVSQSIVADAVSGLSLDRASEGIRLGSSHDTDSVKQPVYQESGVCFIIDKVAADICKKGIVDVFVDKGAAAFNAEAEHLSSISHREVQNIVGPREHEQIPLVNYERDAVELEPSLVMERDLTVECSTVEVAEEEVFSSTMERPMNAAAIAEAEAIARGLQTVRNFDLEELWELGAGTFGTVYHGKWRGTDVAIKRIKSSCFTGKPSECERLIADFWQEAFILGQLHHPNVVAFYGVVPDGPDGTLATVTEYMVNGSLKQALQKKDRILDRRKRLIIAMDAAFGMEYLHKKNVVHFDLKCENLLVNLRDMQRPICKVGDLGLSKVKQQTMISGGVRGTLPWMAPELLNGSSSLVSEKVDVFSFGIVLWELLTGEEPYASMHYGAIIGGIVTNTLRPPVPRWCDASWRSLMEACWAADPVERPTFTEIANSLRAMEATVGAKGQGQAQNVE